MTSMEITLWQGGPKMPRIARVRSHRIATWLTAAATMGACVAAATIATPASSHASDAHWHDSLETAVSAAHSTGKPILAIFTGSDWCPHCKTLEANVLETRTFRDWAADNVVLLEIDMPQQGISRDVRVARSRVCHTYGIRSFPSVVLMAQDGAKVFSDSGYSGQSAPLWIDMVAKHLPPRTDAVAAAPATPPQAAPAGQASKVHATLSTAVASAQSASKPVLLLVSKSGNASAADLSKALLADPEFQALADEHFVVASVPPDASTADDVAAVDRLLGGASLDDDAVELIVTMDGRTPVFSQSGRQPASRIVSGLRRFLTARSAVRHTTAYR